MAIHDNTRVYQPWEKPYYDLSPSDVYNMKTRRIEKYGTEFWLRLRLYRRSSTHAPALSLPDAFRYGRLSFLARVLECGAPSLKR
jgi:hypothetical protein